MTLAQREKLSIARGYQLKYTALSWMLHLRGQYITSGANLIPKGTIARHRVRAIEAAERHYKTGAPEARKEEA